MLNDGIQPMNIITELIAGITIFIDSSMNYIVLKTPIMILISQCKISDYLFVQSCFLCLFVQYEIFLKHQFLQPVIKHVLRYYYLPDIIIYNFVSNTDQQAVLMHTCMKNVINKMWFVSQMGRRGFSLNIKRRNKI